MSSSPENITDLLVRLFEDTLGLGKSEENKKEEQNLIDHDENEIQSNNPNILKNEDGIVCPICFDTPQQIVTLKCGHSFCISCFNDYLKQEIFDAKVPILCADIGCKIEIDIDYLSTFMEPEQRKKYEKFLKRKIILETEGAVECPVADCNSYAINPNLIKSKSGSVDKEAIAINGTDSEKSSKKKKKKKNEPIILKCVDNFHEFCSECLQAPHPGSKCVNQDKFQFNLFKKWEKGKDVQKCPNCKYHIEKNEGCNHMTCIRCRYEFCWICGAKYNYDHFDNPFSPCYKQMFVKHPSIWVRYKIFRILWYLIAIICPGPIICNKIAHLIEEEYQDHFEDHEAYQKFFEIASFFVGIALMPIAYIMLAMAIALSPIVGSIALAAFITDDFYLKDYEREDIMFCSYAPIGIALFIANIPSVIVAIGALIVISPIGISWCCLECGLDTY
ncbi:MAG: hypothetical protein MJ252_17900 [archaeon]|nr:hypothetical protein [archaeon]